MHRVETENPWLFRSSFDMQVDFCIWTLEKDGLQIAPFNAHPEGDGTLRSAGLQAEEWRLWTDRVVQHQYRHFQALSHLARSRLDPSTLLLADVYDPPTSWPGNTAVRTHLDQLWEQYKPLSNLRRKWERPLARQWRPVMQPLWRDLQPYQTRLPALALYLVEYPQSVEYIIPPVSVIMTIVNGYLDGESFRLQVLDAAESLAMAQSS
jgi:hypothetical protein